MCQRVLRPKAAGETRARTSPRGHFRDSRSETSAHAASIEVPANRHSVSPRLDPFTRRDGVQRCTRFVPALAIPAVVQLGESPANRAKADARTRTGDPFITSEVLYQLSYVGKGNPV